jgi:hypothetical protein
MAASPLVVAAASDTAGGGGSGLGGAVFNLGGTLTIENSTLTGNVASGGTGNGAAGGNAYGGAIYNFDGDVSLTNDTIAGNSVDAGAAAAADSFEGGGAVYNMSLVTTNHAGAASLTVGNTLLVNSNIASDVINDQVSGNATINVSGPDLVSAAIENYGGTVSGSFTTVANPHLGPLQDNGGPTDTMALLLGSPAIDAGSDATAATAGLTTDQRGPGFSRVFDGMVDIGAVEDQPLPAEAAQPVLAGGATDGSVIGFMPNGSGQYTETGTLYPFGNINADVRTAVGDVNGDGIPDYILATGPGTPFEVTVIDGQNNSVLVPPFSPFPGFTGGGFVSAGDFLQNGRDQIVVTPDQSGGPRVSIFDLVPGTGLTEVANFFTLDPNFRGGVRTAVGDLNGDGVPDLVVAAGYGGGPSILVINGTRVIGTDGFTPSDDLIGNFYGFDPSLRDGAYVAVGDALGNGQQDLILGPGDGGQAEVLVISGQQLVTEGAMEAIANPVAQFTPNWFGANGSGTRVGVVASGVGDQVNVVAATGRAMPGMVEVYPGTGFTDGSLSEPSGGQIYHLPTGVGLTDGIFVD